MTTEQIGCQCPTTIPPFRHWELIVEFLKRCGDVRLVAAAAMGAAAAATSRTEFQKSIQHQNRFHSIQHLFVAYPIPTIAIDNRYHEQ